VKAAARALGMPLLRTRLSVEGGGEEAARRARYAALFAMARREGCRGVLLAHTADDRAETILLNLLRGAGLRGLGAMPARSTRKGLLLLRPALAVRRAELRRRAAGLPVAEDRSNRSLRFARARARALGLPALEEVWGFDPVPALCALGDLAARVRAVLEEAPAPPLAYAVERARREAGIDAPPLTAAHYAALKAFLAGEGPAALLGPAGETFARTSRGALRVTPASRPPASPRSSGLPPPARPTEAPS